MFSPTTKILGGFLLASVLALGVLGYLYRGEVRAGAATRAALLTAAKANETLTAERDRYKRDAAAESERAQARQRERDGMSAQVAALRQSLGDSLGACPWTDEQAKAIDEFTKGGRP